jgi:hypothetical protein
MVGLDLFEFAGVRLLRQCLIGRAINLFVFIIFFVFGKEQPADPFPFTSGFAGVTAPFVAGRL